MRKLRVAFLAGTLAQGGAEKQLIYMVQSLSERDVDVRVYCLTRGEYYESALRKIDLPPVHVGNFANPAIRSISIGNKIAKFSPHIVQAAHFYTNLYVVLSAWRSAAVGIGSIRNDAVLEMDANPFWGKLLLHLPQFLISNSQKAQINAETLGLRSGKTMVLPNSIDLEKFDTQLEDGGGDHANQPKAVVIACVCRLVKEKRLDRFIDAIALARQTNNAIRGLIVGDGPERNKLEAFALQRGLAKQDLVFLGRRNDIPAILRQVDIFMLTSDHEGFPNVLLEAMAARLPVVTTPAGDSELIVQNGRTGYVVGFEDYQDRVTRLLALASSLEMRELFGQAGRDRVERFYQMQNLADRLLSIYAQIARNSDNLRLSEALSSYQDVKRDKS